MFARPIMSLLLITLFLLSTTTTSAASAKLITFKKKQSTTKLTNQIQSKTIKAPEKSSEQAADPVGDTSAPKSAPADSSAPTTQQNSVTDKDDSKKKIEGSDAMIPKSYNKYQAPKQDGPVNVHFRVLVQYFYSISQREELLDFGLKVFKMWLDPRLIKQNMIIKVNDEKTNEGVEIDPSLVWRPQNELRNAIERTVLSEELVVFPSGHVLLTQRLRVKVTVDFNMQWFPFDQQALTFVFGTFGRATTDRVQLITNQNTSWSPAFPGSFVKENFLIEADLLERPQQSWKILSFYGKEAIVRGDASRLKYSEVNCILRVQRGRWHYIIVFCVPMFLIVLVSSANYNFDMRDLEPRVTVSASLLLALVALQYSIEQQLPSVTYIMWMNWYLFICYLTISLQVASFIVVVSIAGPQEDGTWTKKGHSDFRAKDMSELDDSVQEIMGETKTNPVTGEVILTLSNDDRTVTQEKIQTPDLVKALGLDGGEDGTAAADSANAPLLGTQKRKGKAIYLRILTKREKRALTVDWYFRWSYPLMFIFVTFLMFYHVPYHLRNGTVDKSEASQFEIDYDHGGHSNALSHVNIDDEEQDDGSETTAVAEVSGSEADTGGKQVRFKSSGH